MKTKKVEKTYYVDNGCMILFKGEYGIRFNEWTSLRTEPDLTHCHKITISWEEPEKKIELTESQFEDAVEYADKNHHRISSGEKYMEILKQKLFGENNG